MSSAADESSQLPSNWALIRRMIGLGWIYRVACLRVIVLQSLLVLLALAGLSLTGYGIDVLRHRLTPGDAVPTGPFGWTPPSKWSAFATISVVAGTVLALACFNALLKFVAAVATADLAQRIVVRLRTDVYDKLQRLSFRFFDDRDSSSIINRV
ncbi:MAG TPA: ABC transporter transmembrane domain-containing protein, partial [Planctomycetaceae bacterium]|nr:ABC transporter transmembrane domain-containing protein [Planctomycetaceae bacterium]